MIEDDIEGFRKILNEELSTIQDFQDDSRNQISNICVNCGKKSNVIENIERNTVDIRQTSNQSINYKYYFN